MKRCNDPDAAALVKKANKRIKLVLIAGIILMAADIAASYGGDDVSIVNSGGQTYMVRPGEGSGTGHISLRASVEGKDELFEKRMDISLYPQGEEKNEDRDTPAEMTEREEVERELHSIESGFNSDRSRKLVELPSALESGRKVEWHRERSTDTVYIALMTAVVMFVLYRSRFSALDRKRAEENGSVERDLPEFVNRLVLLMNAGLVLSSAFERAAASGRAAGKNDYFYRRIGNILDMMENANASMHAEFRDFAKESGIKELMRISNIISDNVSKGVELTGKLRTESELLWTARKKSCEERGRLAETKLTMPLVIFLMVLVVITVAPAMLEL